MAWWWTARLVRRPTVIILGFTHEFNSRVQPSFFAYFKTSKTRATCSVGCQLLCTWKCTFSCILSLIQCIHRARVSKQTGKYYAIRLRTSNTDRSALWRLFCRCNNDPIVFGNFLRDKVHVHPDSFAVLYYNAAKSTVMLLQRDAATHSADHAVARVYIDHASVL